VLEVDVTVARREFPVSARFRVEDGECLALFGPSGAGKTTILEAIAGLIDPLGGRVELDGRRLTSNPAASGPPGLPVWRRTVGLLRQDPGLFPHLNVSQNLTYARARRDDTEVQRLVDQLGLGALLKAAPRDLSGGQAQRVALARTLLAHHRVLLLDEPYDGLDHSLRRELTALVRAEVRGRGVPAILVAHELGEAQAFADVLGVFDRGRLLQMGEPSELVRHPLSRRVAELVGYRGFVPLAAGDGTGGAALSAGVHPDRVRLGAHPALGHVFVGQVAASRALGLHWEVDVSVGAAQVTCRMDDAAPRPGTTLHLTAIDPPLFGPDGQAHLSSRPQEP